MPGEYGLIARLIRCIGIALDIGRQRHFTETVQQRFHRFGGFELQPVKPAVTVDHFQRSAVAQCDPAARLGGFRCADLGADLLRRQQTLNQDFNLSAGLFAAEQARRNDPGVVENQQIARLQVIAQLAEQMVFKRSAARRNHQQT